MGSSVATMPDYTLLIQQETEVSADTKTVFDSIIEELGGNMKTPDGKELHWKIEPWPGGRWLRDFGNNTGHLWGHVQVIKPPTILEIYGPLFISDAVISHVQYRVTEKGKGSVLALTHRAFGNIPADQRENINKGWARISDAIKTRAEK